MLIRAAASPGPPSRRRRAAAVAMALAAPVSAAAQGAQSVLAPASADARLVATLTWWFFAVAVFVLIVTLGLLAVGAALNRRPEVERRRISFRTSAIIVVGGGVIAPILAIAGVSISGVAISGMTERWGDGTGPTIEVVGRRWWWEFRYLDEAGEPVAVTANELHLPVGERARLRLISDNVIHSFWAPTLQGKTDLIPGKTNELYAEPEVAGVWRGQCAELCGLQHALMGMLVVAEPREAFDAWLERQASPATLLDHPGREVFMEQACWRCHTVRGVVAESDFGPDLTHVGSRRTLAAATIPNSRGNLGGWITSTQEVKPGSLMPAFTMEAEDLHALIGWLERLE